MKVEGMPSVHGESGPAERYQLTNTGDVPCEQRERFQQIAPLVIRFVPFILDSLLQLRVATGFKAFSSLVVLKLFSLILAVEMDIINILDLCNVFSVPFNEYPQKMFLKAFICTNYR